MGSQRPGLFLLSKIVNFVILIPISFFLPHRGFSIYPIQIPMYIVDLRAYEQRAFCNSMVAMGMERGLLYATTIAVSFTSKSAMLGETCLEAGWSVLCTYQVF